MKFNSQICTDKVQSERLLALGLKKETADCQWFLGWDDVWQMMPVDYTGVGNENIPAWSLGRLIEIMPTTIKSRYGYVNLAVNAELVQYQYYDEDYMRNECCQHFNDGTLYDNIIDCIEWLINEGYFNKEYLVNQAEIEEHCKGVLEYLEYIRGEDE
jgi:hypothetical protein